MARTNKFYPCEVDCPECGLGLTREYRDGKSVCFECGHVGEEAKFPETANPEAWKNTLATVGK